MGRGVIAIVFQSTAAQNSDEQLRKSRIGLVEDRDVKPVLQDLTLVFSVETAAFTAGSCQM